MNGRMNERMNDLMNECILLLLSWYQFSIKGIQDSDALPTDRPTDQPTDQPMDGHDLL